MNQNVKAQKAQRSDNRFLKGALVGGAVGLGIGGVGGYFIARKQMLKKAKEACKKAHKKGYEKGFDDASEAAEKMMAEIEENTIVVDSNNAEDIQKAIAEHEKVMKERKAQAAEADAYREKLTEQIRELRPNHTITEISQRLNIPSSMVYSISKDLEFEKKENVAVENLGNGGQAADALKEAYETAVVESQGNPDEWDLSIDGDLDDEEAAERSKERERYLDLIDEYQKHPEDGPMHISRKEFEEECYLEKDWVTYYAGDNVFASDQDADSPMDGFKNFGVTDGNELFTTRVIDDDDNDDPNITYIRNFALNTVYEVTRTAGSHKKMMSGEAFLEDVNGRADQTGGDG